MVAIRPAISIRTRAEWVAYLIDQWLSVSKITESVGVLKRVFDRIVRDRVIATNPCSLRAVSLLKRLQTPLRRSYLFSPRSSSVTGAIIHQLFNFCQRRSIVYS